jgi:hypothetical protein
MKRWFAIAILGALVAVPTIAWASAHASSDCDCDDCGCPIPCPCK